MEYLIEQICKMDTSLIISLISVMFAILSFAVSIWSNLISRHAGKIAEKTYYDTKSNFEISYQNGFGLEYIRNGELVECLIIQLIIVNKASATNNYRCHLELEYIRDDMSMGKVISNHKTDSKNELGIKDFDLYDESISIAANNSQTKWLLFEVPNTKGYRVINKKIIACDLSGYMKSADVLLVRKINHDKDK